VHYLINRTVLGYEMRAVGHNIDAAEYSGINSKRTVATTLAISGRLAGLAGSTEIIGTYDRFISEWSFGIGWDGITVAVLGNNNPWGVLAAGIFFGALRAGGNLMQTIARVPTEMVSVIQGLIVLFIAAPRIIEWLKDRTETIKEDAAEFLRLSNCIHGSRFRSTCTNEWCNLSNGLNLSSGTDDSGSHGSAIVYCRIFKRSAWFHAPSSFSCGMVRGRYCIHGWIWNYRYYIILHGEYSVCLLAYDVYDR
ncbi:MAG: ABC transporter permease, partial [Candidatus Thorarchaeota archaeon]